jgi:iron complex outermembrane receptor protein
VKKFFRNSLPQYRAILLFASLFFTSLLYGQYKFTGIVKNDKGQPLIGANILLEDTFLGTITNQKGEFQLPDLTSGKKNFSVSYIGYEDLIISLNLTDDTYREIVLDPKSYMGEEAIITAVRAGKKDPVALSFINKNQIKRNNSGKDIPYLLSLTPSIVVTSDAGNGVGYTGLRIRGTDATRINVTIDGIPLNDAESHGVWWVNMPDLSSSIENVQIQRGVGTSTNGAAAFGASINFKTSMADKKPEGEMDFSYGSFNTLKKTLSLGTGLINDQFTFNVRLSEINSDGYIDRAETNLQSIFISSAWYSKKNILKLNIIQGKEKTYQAWDGVPGYLLDTDRTYNGIGKYSDDEGMVKYYDNETDNYQQNHYQLHYSREISGNTNASLSLHYTMGKGYYEQYKEDQNLADYQLDEIDIAGQEIIRTDLIRRKWLDNDFYGLVASVNHKTDQLSLSFGGGFNQYIGDHYGTVIWAQYMSNGEINHRWYESEGDKTDFNLFSRINYALNEKLNLYTDLQLRGINYAIKGIDDDQRDITQNHSYMFFNPKAGFNANLNKNQRIYALFSVANREPTRSNFVDADPMQPLPKFETLLDYEFGYQYISQSFSAGLNTYFMDYNNQLVLTGEINDVGDPVMTNMKDSYRLGIEITGALKLTNFLAWNVNLSLSRNKIKNMTEHVDNWDFWNGKGPYQFKKNLGTTNIAFSPSVIAGSEIDLRILKAVSVSLLSKYVGKQYIDNTSSADRMLNDYLVNDLNINYTVNAVWTKNINIHLLVSNLFNVQYESNGWVYRYFYENTEQSLDGYFPQAGTNFLAGISIQF